MKIHIFCLAFFLFVIPATSYGQIDSDSSEKEAVIAVIDQLFLGMLKGDSSMVRATFDPNMRLMTVFEDKDGKPTIKMGNAEEFIAAVGSPHAPEWREKIWSYDVQIDGRLATAWTEYTFFLGTQLLHCGVNAFQFFESADGWKIIQITDTRRKEGCRAE